MMTTAIVAIRQTVCMCLLLDMGHGFLGHSETLLYIPRELRVLSFQMQSESSKFPHMHVEGPQLLHNHLIIYIYT